MRRAKSPSSHLLQRQKRLRAIARRKLHLEALEDRRVFAGPQLVSLNPNNSDVFNLNGTTPASNLRNIAPREFTFRFDDGQMIDPASVTLAANSIQLIRAGADNNLGTGDDIIITPGYVGVGEASNEVVLRFQESLPNDRYRLTIKGTGTTPVRNLLIAGDPINNGTAFRGNGTTASDKTVDFQLDLGLQVIAIVPQPMVRSGSTWTQNRTQIEVYFNDKDIDVTKITNRNFYQLYFVNDTVQNTDDTVFLPNAMTTSAYDAVNNKVTLTFPQELHLLNGGNGGTYRLRIGTTEVQPAQPIVVQPTGEAGSSFAGADLSTVGILTGTKVVQAAINPENFPLNFPGSFLEPGHRDIQGDDPHLVANADNVDGVTTIFYNFQTPFAFLGGLPQFNLLADPGAIRERAAIREALSVWAHYIGVQFIETADQGITFAKGDLANVGGTSFPGGATALYDPVANLAVLDSAETDWDYNYGQNWFESSMNLIGQALGLDTTGDLPIGVMGGEGNLVFDNPIEPTFPSQQDIVHGQHVFRPDSKDIDIYSFTLTQDGVFTGETFAERLGESSALDTVITLYREKTINGVPRRELIARNDDYFSEDSFLELDLKARDTDNIQFRYYIAVTSTGNTNFDPTIADTGMGGTTQGNYELRLNFRPLVATANIITDQGGVQFDGDNDGVQGGVHNFWFRAVPPSRMLVVDKSAPAGGTGSLTQPFNNIPQALNAALPGYVVRIVGNGTVDGNPTTADTAKPYEIGVDAFNADLPDGRHLNVPKGVTVMIDAGAVLKFRASDISVGSSGGSIDRSQSALQVLGTPQKAVFFTSYDDATLGVDNNPATTPASPGNWGGIIFRNDKDRADQRFDYERQGIFINYVNHADFRYGGGQVSIDSQTQEIAPIHMVQARPNVGYNKITLSATAAMSADPDSFEETNFNSPDYQNNVPEQLVGTNRIRGFAVDYDRIGPDIYWNTVTGNSLNGLFVRIATPAGGATNELTVSGRWDDNDIVHILKENLVIRGTPGGGLQDLQRPPIQLVTLTPSSASGSLPPGTYVYRITFVDQSGTESPPSLATNPVTVAANQHRVVIGGLPPAGAQFRSRRIYRAPFDLATDTEGTYSLVAEIGPLGSTFTDTGANAGGTLNTALTTGIRGRLDARLAVDPNIIVKMDNARIEAGIGSQFIAEGRDGGEVVFTSVKDNRYGAGGTFNQVDPVTAQTPAQRGDWAGVFAGPLSSISLDHAIFAYGGGVTRTGGEFVSYNVLEIHQAEARVVHSTFEYNLDGQGQGPRDRFGAGFNESAAIFVRGSQPIIVDNVVRNTGSRNNLPVPAISINVNSLNHHNVVDSGRSTGLIDLFTQWGDNQGALIRLNRLINDDSLSGEATLTTNPTQINGMDIRGETLDTEVVWDDTDIVHVLRETIYVPDFHTYGGLRIESSGTASLVVKLQGPTAGFTATGRPLDIDDRIGGILDVVGQPLHPVVFSSLRDDSVGAGTSTDGRPQFDTNGDGNQTTPAAGDWRSIRIDQFANDRNVDVIEEKEGSAVQTGITTSIRNSNYSWVLSSVGTNNYYLTTSTGSNPVLIKPEQILLGGVVSNEGLLGGLAPGQWSYGDADGLGYSTVYVRLSDNVDPDNKLNDFVQYKASIAGVNSSPATAEILGQLARNELGGDENQRLGFVVHGFINSPSDVDVYSFIAVAGTEVWLDIDRTGQALDAIVELIDAGGTVLARSDNSYFESIGTATPFGTAKVMQKTPPFNGIDHWTINTHDPGLRVVIPGPRDTINTYHVRVRSNNGMTSGVYQLGVRLREMDEQPGSTVRYADIRYAQSGIEVFGQPTHSPLLGEAAETLVANDLITTAVNVGNILNSDRAAISIAGSLGKALDIRDLGDVDFYRFDVLPDSSAAEDWVSVVFDIDTWKQNVTGDMRLWIFDEAGRLILTSDDSNIADDRPVAVGANNNTELSQGSPDPFDSYIGSVVLPTGSYYAAVTHFSVTPQELNTNPLVRFEPVPSVRRIVEDRIGSSGGSTGSRPEVPVLIDPGTSAIPWHLGDTVLFVAEERDNSYNDPNSTRILAINPFTGAVQAVLTNMPTTPYTSFDTADISDMAFRSDGRLFTFSTDTDDGFRSDAQSGNYLEINTSDGTITFVGDDGIVTYEADPAGLAQNPPVFDPVVGNLSIGNQRVGYGVQFNAMTFANYLNAERLYAIGNRGDSLAEGNMVNGNGISLRENILYEFNPQTGEAIINPGSGTVLPGDRLPEYMSEAGTDAVEHGEVLTAPKITAPDPTTLNANGSTNFVIRDGDTFTVSDGAVTTTFEMDAGFEITQSINLITGQTVRDGNFFMLDDRVFQFDTGPVISINVNGSAMDDGFVVTLQGLNGNTASWEFDSSDPNADPPIPPADPTATLIAIGPGTTALQMTGLLVAAINAEYANLGVAAAAVGTRISLIPDPGVFHTVQLRPPGPTFSSLDITLFGETGVAPIVHITDANAINHLDSFTVQLTNVAQPVNFVFDRNGTFVAGPNQVRVNAPAGATAAQIVQNIVTAVTNAGLEMNAQAVGDKVVINGRGINPVVTVSNLNAMEQLPVDRLITLEETFTDVQVGQAVVTNIAASGLQNSAGVAYAAGADFARINFQNALTADFTGVPRWTQNASRPGVVPGNVQIQFFADDTPGELADRIAAAITTALGPSITATGAIDGAVRLSRGSAAAPVGSRFTIEGEGPGGIVTGMAQVGGAIYVVSSNGGLYTITPSLPNRTVGTTISPIVTTTYIASSRDDLEGINFTGLTAAPNAVEPNAAGVGRYANTLFATDDEGRLYAFNTQGQLQRIFVNGQSSVQIRQELRDREDVDLTIQNTMGLAFGNLQRNLWGATGNRGQDAGHGVNLTYDGNRTQNPNLPPEVSTAGGTSFGFLNYNFVGGAQGSVVSNEFSLVGYSSLDLPMLYFNFFSERGANDSFRVFITGRDPGSGVGGTSDGEWIQLASPPVNTNGNWNQARISLGAFAGWDNLRLRFDFSTAGEMDVGETWSTGDEMRAVSAEFLRDGDTFELFDPNTFTSLTYEFDMGNTLVFPSGAAITEGERIRIGATTYEFSRDTTISAGSVRVAISDLETADQIARRFGALIAGSTVNGERVNLPGRTVDAVVIPVLPVGGTTVAMVTSTITPGSALQSEVQRIALPAAAGAGGSFTLTFSGQTTVPISVNASASTVRQALEALPGIGAGNVLVTKTTSNAWTVQFRRTLANTDVAQITGVGTFGASVGLEGEVGVALTTSGNIPVNINSNMTRTQVANQIDAVLETTLTDQRLVVSNGSAYTEGQTFTITNNSDPTTNVVVRFEIDTGYIAQVPVGGATSIVDGQTFVINNGSGLSQGFIFDLVESPTSTPVNNPLGYHVISIPQGATQQAVAQILANRIGNAPNSAALGLVGSILGNGRVQITGENAVPAIGAAYSITSNTSVLTFSGSPGITNPGTDRRVFITPSINFTAAQVAANIADAINIGVSTGTLLNGNAGFNEIQSLTITGTSPGVPFTLTFQGQTTVPISNTATAAEIQAALVGLAAIGNNDVIVTQVGPGDFEIEFVGALAITNVAQITTSFPDLELTATLDPNDQRRIILVRDDLSDPILVTGATFTTGANLTLEMPTNISKQYQDLLRIIGWEVNDPGPLGLEVRNANRVWLQNDVAGIPLGIADDIPPYIVAPAPNGYNSPVRFQDNAHEGVYFDDIIIGFAERGELITAANPNAVMNVPQDLPLVNDELLFAYNLEIRRTEDYAVPSGFSWQNRFGEILSRPQYNRSIDTNDRMSASYQLTIPAGNQIADGQTFYISDGITTITFEFDDLNSPVRTQQGNIAIPFDSTMSSDIIAALVRDAVNSVAVQAVLGGVRAILSDGAFQGAFSNSSIVNLTAAASVEIQVQTTGFSITNTQPLPNQVRDRLLVNGMSPTSNATYIGGLVNAGLTGNASVIGLGGGAMFATGDVSVASAPNTDDKSTGISSKLPDADLFAATFVDNYDSTSLEFEFDWDGSGPLEWNYVFASDEHNEDSTSQYNDAMAIILDGPNLPAPINLALDPFFGLPITVNNINAFSPPPLNSLYNNNDPGDEGPLLSQFGYDGYTDVLTATTSFYEGLVGLDGLPVIFDDPSTPLVFDPILAAGQYTIKFVVSDAGEPRPLFTADTGADSALIIQSANPVASQLPPRGIQGQVFNDYGDTNLVRDQGQILILSNVIRDSANFGINVDAGARNPPTAPLAGTLPHQGAPRNLRDVNVARTSVGPVIMNNVIARAGTAGIQLSGDPNGVNTQLAAVPFSHVINNTVVGAATGAAAGVGISVNQNVSPTLMNNIVSNWATGIQVDATSTTTVLDTTLYKDNTANVTGIPLGPRDIVSTRPLFIGAATDNYYLAQQSEAIDRANGRLEDRNALIALRSPLNISNSPMLVSDLDVFGQFRYDDPLVTNTGLSERPFSDLGAIEHVDTTGPTALLINPPDNGLGDTNAVATIVDTTVQNLTNFRIELADGVQPADPVSGIGVDDATVTADTLTLSRDGVLLVQGTDYTFSYDSTSNAIILVPLTGIWLNGSYVITLDNSATGIMDLAGNRLKPNQLDLTTTFTINLNTQGGGGPTPSNFDFGDAPARYPTTLPNGARHEILGGFQLGDGIDAESNGLPTANADGDAGDDDGITFVGGTTVVRGRSGLSLTAIASENGVLDAWIDWNGDGDWADAGEQIATNVSLVGLTSRTITYAVPTTAIVGQTFARFRLSKAGNLGPTGPAADGEVEDYSLQIINNPWQNPASQTNPNLRYDVSGDGLVSPIDALLIINRLNFQGPTPVLPVPPPPGSPPPYYDVDGDGGLSASDAASVITFLNARPQAEGEAASVDVNPSASAARSDEVARSTGTASTEDAESSSPSLLPGPAGESGDAMDPLESGEGYDFDIYGPAKFNFDNLPLDLIGSEEDDELDAICAGGQSDESSDDFFAWFGQ